MLQRQRYNQLLQSAAADTHFFVKTASKIHARQKLSTGTARQAWGQRESGASPKQRKSFARSSPKRGGHGSTFARVRALPGSHEAWALEETHMDIDETELLSRMPGNENSAPVEADTKRLSGWGQFHHQQNQEQSLSYWREDDLDYDSDQIDGSIKMDPGVQVFTNSHYHDASEEPIQPKERTENRSKQRLPGHQYQQNRHVHKKRKHKRKKKSPSHKRRTGKTRALKKKRVRGAPRFTTCGEICKKLVQQNGLHNQTHDLRHRRRYLFASVVFQVTSSHPVLNKSHPVRITTTIAQNHTQVNCFFVCAPAQKWWRGHSVRMQRWRESVRTDTAQSQRK